MFSAQLGDLSWQEIKEIGDSGMASQLFSLGDSKAFGEYTATIAGFNVDIANSSNTSEKAPYTFTTDYLYEGTAMSDMQSRLLSSAVSKFNSDLPADLKAVIRPIYKGERSMFSSRVSWKKYDYGFVPQAANYFGFTTLTFSPPDGFDGGNFSTSSGEVTTGLATQYPYFTSASRRSMGQEYFTSSPCDNELYMGYVVVNSSGYSELTVRDTHASAVRMAFCI